jgi:hypothetical protein
MREKWKAEMGNASQIGFAVAARAQPSPAHPGHSPSQGYEPLTFFAAGTLVDSCAGPSALRFGGCLRK